jgi:LysR family transcriptional activator of nhaA
MEWLNYHHLLYFWTAAREGSMTRAGQELRLAQSTVSAQIRRLEEALDERLFRREGRRVVLTDVGRVVYRYADEIFALGRELLDTVKDRPTGRPLRFNVGVADQLPKAIAHRLLAPVLELDPPVRIVCQEGKAERLLADLALHELDLVLTDAPVSPGAGVRAFNHLLGECDVAFFGVPRLAAGLRRRFPACLDGAPMLLPTAGTVLRRSLDHWLDSRELRPRIVSEFEDSALLNAFGQSGAGVFPAPSLVEREVCRQYGVRVVGRVPEVRERFYAISVERRLKHPAVRAISDAARDRFVP